MADGDHEDKWAAWLAGRRHGGDPGSLRRVLEYLAPVRDRVIANAGLTTGDRALDVGCVRAHLRGRKAAAFAEFYRVLRRGGRLSLFEPVNRFASPEPADRFSFYDVGPVAGLAGKVKALYEALQPPGSDPMLDFDERDLVSLAEGTGFKEVHLTLQVDIESPEPRPWPAFLNTAGNPRIPTLAEAMAQTLLGDEAERLGAHLRPLVERGEGQRRAATAFLRAVR